MSREGRRRWAVNERFIVGKPGNPMLERWRLVQTPWFGLYVHFIYREDLDREPHDHPWWFGSLVLRGGYDEELHADKARYPSRAPVTVTHGRWSRHGFPLADAHRITKVRPGTVTLVLVGHKQRIWGFYQDFGGQVVWVDYRLALGLGLRPTEGVSG